MMTKLKKNNELIQILQDAGIVIKEYANPRSAGTPAEFILSTIPGGRGILIKNSDMATLEVATDSKHKQAVLTVKEGKRKISRNVSYTLGRPEKGPDSEMEHNLKRRFPISIPGAKFTVSNMKAEVWKNKKGQEQGWKYSGTVTATVTKTRKNTFLLGMDETSHFISVLPEQVKSVKEAHSLLRPKGLPASTKRQGEFFFKPAVKRIAMKAIKGDVQIRQSVPLERGSNHYAQYAIINIGQNRWASKDYGTAKPLYVRGLIFDKRGYRHAPVDLGDVWHKVVRNKESMTAVPKGTRAAGRYD